MALNLASPGIQIREVDLTVGRADTPSERVGAIAGPFTKGPVNKPILIKTETDLINYFGKPSKTDNQYEYWFSASNFLSYGGVLRVVRTNNSGIRNASAGISTSIKILSQEDYTSNWSNSSSFYFAAKDPGSWGNGLKVCTIDNGADQIIGLSTSNPQSIGAEVGYGVTIPLNNVKLNATENFTGYLKGVITKVNQSTGNTNSSIEVKIVSRVSAATTSYRTTLSTLNTNPVGAGDTVIYLNSTAGVNTLDTFNVSGIATHIAIVSVASTFITLASGVSTSFNAAQSVTLDRLITTGGVETEVDYVEKNRPSSIFSGDGLKFIDTSGNLVSNTSTPVLSVSDWYNNQTLGLTNSTVYWKSIAPKPNTSSYAKGRSGKNDELHIVIVDDSGSITGVSQNIVEKYTNLSKASDAILFGKSIYYKNVISNSSAYIYAGTSETGSKSTISADDVLWNTETTVSGKNYNVIGSKTYTLASGKDYDGGTGTFSASISDVIDSYALFENKGEYTINYIIGGPFNGPTIEDSQSKANALIGIAEMRKDCIALISPDRESVVDVASSNNQTNNIIEFFGPLQSSSYAIFDSGYKYMFNRFENRFDYVPCNADVAGLLARTAIQNYPWYSPAGTTRGVLNNAIKLAYNPSQDQRDLLYINRVNAIAIFPGSGAVLYGDKTGLIEVSAFDRINVRTLFLTIEDAIQTAANAQLFEFNDIITRANFVNIVEPYLRDVKAKRGLYEFTLVCDESNNTNDAIDSNQFKADIYIKPARSINFIGLTFVATRTGVSFEEIVGTV